MRIIQKPIIILFLIFQTSIQFSCSYENENTGILYRILIKLKFRVTEISVDFPSRLKKYDVLFLQDLIQEPIETEIEKIQEFVRDGGTLVVSGVNDNAINGLIEDYGLKLHSLTERIEFSRRVSQNPYFPQHPVDEIQPRANDVIESQGRNVTILYGSGNKGVVVTLDDGEGHVFFITSTYMFQEEGLLNSHNADFLYNLISTFPRTAHIGLAEGRYYSPDTKPPNTFVSLVFKTPVGLACVYICLILFVFLILRGKRFGKPIDIHEKNRRLSSEYVIAMTSLYQKNNTRMDILQHIRDKFRIELGVRWRVNPNIKTSKFLEELHIRGAVDDEGLLAALLKDLDKSTITEKELLELAKRVDTFHKLSKSRI